MKKAFWGKNRVLVDKNVHRIDRYCTNCGESIPAMTDPYDHSYCPKCGAEIDRKWENDYRKYTVGKDPERTKTPMAWTAMRNEEEGDG